MLFRVVAVLSMPTEDEFTVSGFDLQTPPRLVRKLKTEPFTDGRPPIWGVARLNDELFIITGLDVEVYDATGCSYKRRWKNGAVRNPQDVVASETHKCLYIVDWILQKILKYNSVGKSTSNWSIKGNGLLSLTPQSTVLFASNRQKKLIEYDSNGNSLRTVNLGTGKDPVHAVKLENGHYVLIYGEKDRQSVCVVDENGTVTEVYSRNIDVALGSLIHVTASREGFFLVADWVSGAVIVLDSKLKYQRTLLGRENRLRRPARMYLDENSRRLYVADNFSGLDDGRVLIFAI